jgi:hypothetical protein
MKGETTMEHICLILPILSGQSEDARAFQAELDGPRKTEYDVSERRIGITKEVWFVAPVAGGEQFVAYIETNDFGNAFQTFVESREPFDMWFKERLANATGVDLNDPPPMELPELVSTYVTA